MTDEELIQAIQMAYRWPSCAAEHQTFWETSTPAHTIQHSTSTRPRRVLAVIRPHIVRQAQEELLREVRDRLASGAFLTASFEVNLIAAEKGFNLDGGEG